MKKIWRQLHLWLGLVSGLIVLLICLSGALFVFAEEVLFFGLQEHLKFEPKTQKRVPIDSVIKDYQEANPDAMVFWANLYPNNTYNYVLATSGNPELSDANVQFVFIDPYSGKITHTDTTYFEFFFKLGHFHSELLLGSIGIWIIRISTLLFLLEIVLGVILWWPKKRKKAVKEAFVLNPKNTRQPWYLQLHKVYGFYGLWALLILLFSGLFIGMFPKGTSVLNPLANGTAINSKTFKSSENPMQEIYKFLHSERPDLETILINNPQSPEAPLDGILNTNTTFLFMSGSSFSTVNDTLEDKENLQQEAASLLNLSLHTGSWAGWPIKVIAMLVGLFGASLPITGFMIWWYRTKTH